jgi:hypothetical protein
MIVALIYIGLENILIAKKLQKIPVNIMPPVM